MQEKQLTNEYWAKEIERLYFCGYTLDRAKNIVHQRRKEHLQLNRTSIKCREVKCG